jgi:hypothetical protein
MTKKPHSFDELLALWETPKSLSVALGIPYVNAQAIKRRKSLDVAHWPRMIELAAARGIQITNDDLVGFAIKRREAA